MTLKDSPASFDEAKTKDRRHKNGQGKMKRKTYEKELHKLQVRLCHLQDWVREKGLRIIILFEGRDAAGKGGTIKAITERVSPRVFRVVALPAPSDREKTQLYLQRYIERFPAAGEVVIFDRSWYNRAGVEYVMGFCTKRQHERFLDLCAPIEKFLVDSGIRLIKIWLEVGKDEQDRRFSARIEDPLRQWKLSPMDIESYNRWDEYSRGARPDAQDNRQQARALVHRSFRRQAAGTAQLHFPHSRPDSVQKNIAAQGQAAQAGEQTKIRRSGGP